MTLFADIFVKIRRILNPPPFLVSWGGRGITRGQLFFYFYPRRWFLCWNNIVTVHGRKVDKICFEENYFIFEDKEGEKFFVGELDKGFFNFELEIFRRYPHIKKGWMAELEMNPAGIDFLLWPRQRSEPSIDKVLINKRARSRRLASRKLQRKRG